jgi:hypothetical protein
MSYLIRRYCKKLLHTIHARFGILNARLINRLHLQDLSQNDFLRSLTSEFSSIDTFIPHQAKRLRPTFVLIEELPYSILETLEQICPGIKERVISRADQVCEHIFDLWVQDRSSWARKLIGTLILRQGIIGIPSCFIKM